MNFRHEMKDSLSIGLLIFFLSFFLCTHLFYSQIGSANGEEQAVPEVPSLEETIQLALKQNPGEPQNEIIYSVKENYYLIQLKSDQLEILEEVQEHFETAIEKAEEKMESDEADVTQSQITKLKLGRAGAVSDIIKYQSASLQAKLSLGRILGVDLSPEAELSEKKLVQLRIPYETLEDYLRFQNGNPGSTGSGGVLGQLKKIMSEEKALSLKEAFIKLNEKRELAALARKNRRMTRALLVTEVANYDFGLGDGGDLFEALIIYTRLLNGFHQSVYGFNLAVVNLDKIYSQ